VVLIIETGPTAHGPRKEAASACIALCRQTNCHRETRNSDPPV